MPGKANVLVRISPGLMVALLLTIRAGERRAQATEGRGQEKEPVIRGEFPRPSRWPNSSWSARSGRMSARATGSAS